MRTAQLQAKAGRNKAIDEVTEDQVGYGVNRTRFGQKYEKDEVYEEDVYSRTESTKKLKSKGEIKHRNF